MLITIDNFIFNNWPNGFYEIAYLDAKGRDYTIVTNSPHIYQDIICNPNPSPSDLVTLKKLCMHKIATWPAKKSGGSRPGSGRPAKAPTKVISVRVPADRYQEFKNRIDQIVKK